MQLFWIAIVALAAGLVLLIANHDSGQVFGIENSTFASVLYLGLWAAVLIVGIAGSRLRMSQALRDAAYWLLILLVLMTGYQYRYELQDVASRLTAGLVPGSPMTVSTAGQSAVMLDKSRNGHFEVRALMNGTTVRAMVDTGASTTVLTSEDAARAGIAVGDLSFTTPVITANGMAMAAPARLDSLSIGPIERSGVPILVAQSGRLHQSLLGMQFLSSLSSFEMRGDRLILRD